MARRKKSDRPTMSDEEYRAWLEQQTIIERDGATYVVVDGYEYPLGLEPDPTLTGRDLLIAQKKDEVWMWAVRLGLLAIIIIIGLVIFFSLTA